MAWRTLTYSPQGHPGANRLDYTPSDRYLPGHRRRFRLTPRQLEVCAYAATGASNAEIATMLGISEKTVRRHMFNAMNILDAKNRTEAIYKLGWIHIPS